jgi:dTDP-4-amino-4,6-dideoxygalactose transaminase
MTEIQAAMGIVGMESLEANLGRRADIAIEYMTKMNHQVVELCPQANHVNWGYFPIRLKERDKLWAGLREKGIDARKYFSPCHKMKAYDTGQTLPVTEKLAQEVLTLPIWAGMPDEDVNSVIATVKGVIG